VSIWRIDEENADREVNSIGAVVGGADGEGRWVDGGRESLNLWLDDGIR
jgi:hypothetical protein